MVGEDLAAHLTTAVVVSGDGLKLLRDIIIRGVGDKLLLVLETCRDTLLLLMCL